MNLGNLFKSRQQIEFDQQVAIRTATSALGKQEKLTQANIEKLAGLARTARDYGDTQGYEMTLTRIDQALKFQKLIVRQKIVMESQKIALEQFKTTESFVKATEACSQALFAIFNRLDLRKVSAQAQLAEIKSDVMQGQIDEMMDGLLSGGSAGATTTSREELESIVNGADKATSLGELSTLKEQRELLAQLKQSIKAKPN